MFSSQKLILLALIFCVATPRLSFAASPGGGVKVLASIESYDRTLASGELYAKTFEEAVTTLANQNSIEIISSFDEKTRLIQSVGGIANGTFGKSDAWFGYIERNGKILRPDVIMNEILVPGDYVVLCYGDPDRTKIVSSFDISINGDTTRIHIKSVTSGLGLAPRNLADARIHFIAPTGSVRIAKTDRSGTAQVKLGEMGMYKYFAESYEIGSLPDAVRTRDYYGVFGMDNQEGITRAEAAAFIVNSFNIPGSGRSNPFKDVDRNNPYYREINAAYTAGLVRGYDDNTFNPHGKINLLQLTVMMSGLSKNTGGGTGSLPEVPAWATQSVRRVTAAGLLDGVERNWSGDVTPDILRQIYINHMEKQS